MIKKLTAKPIVKQIYERISEKSRQLVKEPCLILISVGYDPASDFYIRNIIKNAQKVGILVKHQSYPENISEKEVLSIINSFNNNNDIDAIMVQKPLPKHIDDNLISSNINPDKDVDGFSPVNLGRLLTGQKSFIPCTPLAVMTLIDYYEIELAGKHTVLCGRSLIVGKPLLNLLIKKDSPGNATVTLCHSKTKNLPYFTSQADILITSLGIPFFIKQEHIKEGVILIDVGINEVISGDKRNYVGDIDFDDCFEKSSAITPVPGGIGSITTAMLMSNIISASMKV